MIKILFICHGNICRSPMAEYVMKDLVKKRGLNNFYIASVATSREEIGNDVHYGTLQKLNAEKIACPSRKAVQMVKNDYEAYDYLLCMDQNNIRNAMRILGSDPEHKLMRLLDFSKNPRDIADPWYTGNFDETYRDIVEGCQALLNHIEKEVK